jgi:hypothetical protein
VELAERVLGWRPATSLRAGLRRTWLTVRADTGHGPVQVPTAESEPRG